MFQVQQRVLKKRAVTLLCALGLLAQIGQAVKFYDDDPITKEPKPLNVANASSRQINDIYDFFYMSFAKHPPEGLSLAANTLGEVPDSDWYTNRHGAHRMSVEELVRGPNLTHPPDTSRRWRIVSAKTDGVTPGFRIEDASGAQFLLKLDPARFPEMASAADVIGAKFFYAFGYNTPENYIVHFKRDQFLFDESVKLEIHGRVRPLTPRGFAELFKDQPTDSAGRYRAMASRIIAGKTLGQFRYYGTRADDPNDVVPHQRRRDLRGLFVFCAWLSHDDSRDINTIDSLIEEDGVSHIKHYLIDFGAIFGSNSYRPDSARNGFEYLWDPKPAYARFLTFGLYVPRWSRSQHYLNLPAVGRFEYELFDPDQWKPEYPNIAFHNRTAGDEFWAAKQVMAFTDDDIRAIVKTGEFTDPRADEWIVKCLVERRNKIGRTYFAKVLPLDDFRFDDARLQFTDLGAKYGFYPARQYAIQWSLFDNEREQSAPLANASDVLRSRDGYFAAAISGGEAQKNVTVYLRKRGAAVQVAGVDR
jgi:hypothetical protein